MDPMELDQAQREDARWRIMNLLNKTRPSAISETIVHRHLAHDLEMPYGPHAVRKELLYLRDKGLVEIPDTDASTWIARVTVDGVDVVEYAVDCPAGIARPRKFY